MSVGDGGKVAPPGDGGCAEGGEVLVDDCHGGGQRPSGEADAGEGLVVFDQASKGPQGRGDIFADAVDETRAHSEEEGGGWRLRGGSRPVQEPLVEDGVPLGEIGAVAKESLARASATLRQVAIFGKSREGERVDSRLEGTGQLVEFGAAFLVRDGAVDEAEVMANATVEFAKGSGGAAITAAAKGAVQPGELGSVVRVGGEEVVDNASRDHTENVTINKRSASPQPPADTPA